MIAVPTLPLWICSLPRPLASTCSMSLLSFDWSAENLSGSTSHHPTAEWIARQVTEAFPWSEAPHHLIRDGIGSTALPSPTDYGPWASATSRLLAPGSPWQNDFAERLIGSIRRECVGHIVVLGEAHLRRILTRYAAYYNELRTHRSLGKDAPIHRASQHIGRIASEPVVGGLHHHYCRI